MIDGRTKLFLQSFGVGNDYQGADFCSYSIELAYNDPGSLRHVTKNIYPEVAKRYKTSTICVERNIRTVAEAVWRNGAREFFYVASGRLWEKRPSNARFLQILLEYILSDKPIPDYNKTNPCECCEILLIANEKIMKLETENMMLKEKVRCMDKK